MSDLRLSIAMGDYDRTRPIADGRVKIDGVDPAVMLLTPEEMFFRAMRHRAFDICELSLSSYAISVARGEPHYVAVPVYLSRAFRHTSIYIRTDRGIDRPEDSARPPDRHCRISAFRQCLGARHPGRGSQREAVGNPLGARRHGHVGPAGEDCARPACGRERGAGARGRDHERHAYGRGNRRLHRPARDSLLRRRPPEGRPPVRRFLCRGGSVLPAPRCVSDHACIGGPAGAGRRASLATQRPAEGLHPIQADGAGRATRHFSGQGDPAFPGRQPGARPGC